jgi:hypothetical protein
MSKPNQNPLAYNFDRIGVAIASELGLLDRPALEAPDTPQQRREDRETALRRRSAYRLR